MKILFLISGWVQSADGEPVDTNANYIYCKKIPRINEPRLFKLLLFKGQLHLKYQVVVEKESVRTMYPDGLVGPWKDLSKHSEAGAMAIQGHRVGGTLSLDCVCLGEGACLLMSFLLLGSLILPGTVITEET